MKENTHYSLSTGEQGKERLGILNKLCNPNSVEFLKQSGIKPGMCVLDIGCGTGLMSCELAKLVGKTGKIIGVDASKDQVAIAAEIAKKNHLHNIKFFNLPAENISEIKMQFDFIYCRYLLMHIANPQQLVNNCFDLLKNKGVMVCEEVAGFEGSFCYPPSDIFHRFLEMCFKHAEIHGKDYYFDIRSGRKLYQYFTQTGFQLLNKRVVQLVLIKAEEKKLLRLGVIEKTNSLVKSGLATHEEIEHLCNELVSLEQDDSRMVAFNPYMQMSAVKITT